MKVYSHPSLNDVSLATVMQALSDPCRIAIVRTLLESDECACNEVPLDVSKATRSHHFDVLRAAGLVHSRVVGTKCKTSLRKGEINGKFPGLLDLIIAAGNANANDSTDPDRSVGAGRIDS
jgi:DNA-binding transcriptional ArsR family regulator